MTIQETSAITVGAGDRADILSYASWIVSGENRNNPEAVLSAAAPLLAAGKADLRARMAALSRQYQNTRRGAGTPHGFVDDARAYYAFITGAAA